MRVAAPGWCAHMLEQARPVPFARRDIPPLQALYPSLASLVPTLPPPPPNLSLPPFAYRSIPSSCSANGAGTCGAWSLDPAASRVQLQWPAHCAPNKTPGRTPGSTGSTMTRDAGAGLRLAAGPHRTIPNRRLGLLLGSCLQTTTHRPLGEWAVPQCPCFTFRAGAHQCTTRRARALAPVSHASVRVFARAKA